MSIIIANCTKFTSQSYIWNVSNLFVDSIWEICIFTKSYGRGGLTMMTSTHSTYLSDMVIILFFDWLCSLIV